MVSGARVSILNEWSPVIAENLGVVWGGVWVSPWSKLRTRRLGGESKLTPQST